MRNYMISLLRILACVAVFLVHFSQRMDFSGVLRVVTDIGQFGVELFFILSGYVACVTWFKDNADHSLKNYYIKRCIRILPLYYVVIFYFLLTEKYLFHSVPVDTYGLGKLRYIFLLNGIVPSDGYFWGNLGITWTIPIFMMFYLLFPVMAKYANSFKNSVLLVLFCYVLANYFSDGFFGYFNGVTYMVYFALGIMAYFAVKENKKQIATALALVLLVVNNFTYVIDNTQFHALLLFILLLAVVDIEIKNKHAVKLLTTLDKYTYTFYLAHGVIFCGVIDKYWWLYYQRALIGICGSILLTLLLYHLVEVPLQKLLSRLLLPQK